MVENLLVWCDLYDRLKSDSLCIDIETTRFNGPISVLGLYRPRDGVIEYEAFVKGQNLSGRNLKTAFANCKLLITFNGLRFDIPHIRKWFPGALPNLPVIDLYLFARRLGLNASLKVIESTLGIDRLEMQGQQKIAVRLWQRFERYQDHNALRRLLEYNRQDTINLYPLAEELVALTRKTAGEQSCA